MTISKILSLWAVLLIVGIVLGLQLGLLSITADELLRESRLAEFLNRAKSEAAVQAIPQSATPKSSLVSRPQRGERAGILGTLR